MAKPVGGKVGEETIELRSLDVCSVLEVNKEGEEDCIEFGSTHAEFSMWPEKAPPLLWDDAVRVVEVEHGQQPAAATVAVADY